MMSFMETITWFQAHLTFSDMIVSLVGAFIFWSLVERLTNKQGPMFWPVVGIIPTLILHISDVYDWITECLITNGGTFAYKGLFMGTFGIMTADPSKIEYMLKTRFSNFPKGRYYRERFQDLLGEGIFNVDDELWKQQRRIAVSEMHSSHFVEFSMQTVQDLVHEKLLKLLEKVMLPRDYFDLQDILLRFTFDNVCLAAFGVDPGFLSLDLPDVPFAKAFEEATQFSLLRFTRPPFVWKAMKFFGLGSENRLKDAVQVVHDFASKIVNERKEELKSCLGGSSKRSDLLSTLILNGFTDPKGNKTIFSDKLLQDFCISFILAGRDTSSVALAWFFWLIYENPRAEFKILEEIRQILDGKSMNEDEDLTFTQEELKKMVYLQAALSEALRLYPSVPIDFKEVLEDDVFPDGTVIRRGARVLYSIYSMARMEAIWGKDCSEFKPERWIRNGQFVSENQFKYPVFNAGPRLCVGKRFAYMQMKMVAASILLRYSVKVVAGHDVSPKFNTTLYMKHGLLVKLQPRT